MLLVLHPPMRDPVDCIASNSFTMHRCNVASRRYTYLWCLWWQVCNPSPRGLEPKEVIGRELRASGYAASPAADLRTVSLVGLCVSRAH